MPRSLVIVSIVWESEGGCSVGARSCVAVRGEGCAFVLCVAAEHAGLMKRGLRRVVSLAASCGYRSLPVSVEIPRGDLSVGEYVLESARRYSQSDYASLLFVESACRAVSSLGE